MNIYEAFKLAKENDLKLRCLFPNGKYSNWYGIDSWKHFLCVDNIFHEWEVGEIKINRCPVCGNTAHYEKIYSYQSICCDTSFCLNLDMPNDKLKSYMLRCWNALGEVK